MCPVQSVTYVSGRTLPVFCVGNQRDTMLPPRRPRMEPSSPHAFDGWHIAAAVFLLNRLSQTASIPIQTPPPACCAIQQYGTCTFTNMM